MNTRLTFDFKDGLLLPLVDGVPFEVAGVEIRESVGTATEVILTVKLGHLRQEGI